MATSSNFSGLDKIPSIEDLLKSRDTYNSLLKHTQQPHISENHLLDLAALFVHHNAQSVFGVHLVHGHFQIPENTIMLGSNFENPRGRWTKVTDISAVDLSAVHGHMFAVTSDGFTAYEYQDGPMPDLSSISKRFYTDFVEYLVKNGLTNLLGLQVLMQGVKQSMSEFTLDQGTVMLDASAVVACSPKRIIGWRFVARNGQPRVCQSYEEHAGFMMGNHKVFDVGKSLPKLKDIDDLKRCLTDLSVL